MLAAPPSPGMDMATGRSDELMREVILLLQEIQALLVQIEQNTALKDKVK